LLSIAYTLSYATPADDGTQAVVLSHGKKVIEKARSNFTDSYESFTEASNEFKELVKLTDQDLDDEEKNQRESVDFLQKELTEAIDELYQVETEIAIIPDVVRFNEKLVAIASFFKQESGITIGNETLPCGENGSCARYQNRRNALSHMIAALADDLNAVSAFAGRRSTAIKSFATEIDALRNGRKQQLAPFGLDYFFNKRIALLEVQEDIFEDSRRISRGTYIDGSSGRIGAPCSPGRFTYTDIIRELVRVNDLTRPFQYIDPNKGLDPLTLYNPSKWAEQIITPIRKEYDGSSSNGIEYPGWLDNWGGCYATKLNILNDIKKKVTNELTLGNIDAAQLLDEQSLPLEVETAQLLEQKKRIEEGRGIIDSVRGSVFAFIWSPGPKAPWYPEWKEIVRVQANNFARIIDTELDILVSGRSLIRRAISEFLTVGTVVDREQLESKLFTLMRRLQTIANHGFGRLIEEIALSTDTMMVMSANIKALEGTDDEGGLGETVLTFENSVKIRQAQMFLERDKELPERKAKAEQLVAKLETQLDEAAKLLAQVKQKRIAFQNITTRTESIINDLKNFFSIKLSHPLYIAIAQEYNRRLAPPPAFGKTLSEALLKFIKGLHSTTVTSRAQSTIVSVVALGGSKAIKRRARKVSRQMSANIANEIDERSKAQLNGRTLSEMIEATTNALDEIDRL